MNIAVDAMGGDFAPRAVVEGVLLAAADLPAEVRVLLIGQREAIDHALGGRPLPPPVEVVHTPEVIEMGEHPTRALTQKPNSSIAVGFGLLKAGQADVFCSAGNTGAMHVGALFSVKALRGVMRPAIAGFAPQVSGRTAVIPVSYTHLTLPTICSV